MCYVLRLQASMVPALSPPGSSVPASILAIAIAHGTLQRSNNKCVSSASLGHGELQQHIVGISSGFRQTCSHFWNLLQI